MLLLKASPFSTAEATEEDETLMTTGLRAEAEVPVGTVSAFTVNENGVPGPKLFPAAIRRTRVPAAWFQIPLPPNIPTRDAGTPVTSSTGSARLLEVGDPDKPESVMEVASPRVTLGSRVIDIGHLAHVTPLSACSTDTENQVPTVADSITPPALPSTKESRGATEAAGAGARSVEGMELPSMFEVADTVHTPREGLAVTGLFRTKLRSSGFPTGTATPMEKESVPPVASHFAEAPPKMYDVSPESGSASVDIGPATKN